MLVQSFLSCLAAFLMLVIVPALVAVAILGVI